MKKILVIIATVFYSNICVCQGSFDLNIGTAKTELKNNALRIGVNYLANTFEAISDKQINGKKSLFVILPEFTSEEGSDDAFSSIVAKVTGFASVFKKHTINGIPIPDLQKTFHTFPMSIGAETNGSFSYANMIIEGGWAPWYYQPTNNVSEFLRHTKFAIFLQGGYKFIVDTANSTRKGGALDESSEQLEKGIFRSKLAAELDTKNLLRKKNSFGLVILGGTNLWYDFVNKEIYYKLYGKARLYMTKSYYFDFIYEKGSGAPNFNQGDQYGVNLGVSF